MHDRERKDSQQVPHTAYLQGTSSDAPFMLRRKWWRAEMQPYVAAEMQLAARALEPQVDTRLPRAGREADSTGGASKGCLHSVGWPQAQLLYLSLSTGSGRGIMHDREGKDRQQPTGITRENDIQHATRRLH